MKFIYISLLIFINYCSVISQTDLYDYDVEERITELGIELSTPVLPKGINIELATKSGNLVYLSGNGPRNDGENQYVGKVGGELTVEQGYEAARLTAINHLSVLKAEIGDLNKVVKIVKVLGLVNATPDFTRHPAVINGYSDLMIEVFGERGRGARSAMGMGSLPWNLACEVEAIVEVIE
jgi:enamine deaminase RidA (YjgF/YER057c/UK114 family)